MYGEIKQVIYFIKKLNIAVFALLISGCATVEIKKVDCSVNQNWPNCRVVAEEV